MCAFIVLQVQCDLEGLEMVCIYLYIRYGTKWKDLKCVYLYLYSTYGAIWKDLKWVCPFVIQVCCDLEVVSCYPSNYTINYPNVGINNCPFTRLEAYFCMFFVFQVVVVFK